MTNQKGLNFLYLLFISAVLASCSVPKKIYYAEQYLDSTKKIALPLAVFQSPPLQPYDVVSIVFSGKSEEVLKILNSGNVASTSGIDGVSKTGGDVTDYQLAYDGKIELPKLGTIKAAGLTLNQLKDTITLLVTPILVDAKITIKYKSFKINVLGEVRSPGTYSLARDKNTIFDAIALTGDISIYGLKQKVKIIRDENGEKEIGNIDLTDKSAFVSPYFYLKPNDILYIPPNGNQYRGQALTTVTPYISLGITILSLALTLISFFR